MASTGERLIARVMKKVKDPAIDEVNLLLVLNEGLDIISSTVLLPGLEDVAQVTTVLEEYSVELPDNYHRGLFRCRSVLDNRPVTVLNNKSQLFSEYPDITRSGDVESVCTSGSLLLYQYVPTVEETLNLSYYRIPSSITETTATDAFTPDCISNGERALFHYGCWMAYHDFEDGIDGNTANTEKQEGYFLKCLDALKSDLKESQSFPSPPVCAGCFK